MYETSEIQAGRFQMCDLVKRDAWAVGNVAASCEFISILVMPVCKSYSHTRF